MTNQQQQILTEHLTEYAQEQFNDQTVRVYMFRGTARWVVAWCPPRGVYNLVLGFAGNAYSDINYVRGRIRKLRDQYDGQDLDQLTRELGKKAPPLKALKGA